MRWRSFCPGAPISSRAGALGFDSETWDRKISSSQSVLSTKLGAPSIAFFAMGGIAQTRQAFALFVLLAASTVSHAQAAPPAPPAPSARYVVVLDAAHGGDDSGAHLSSGQQEKNVTLALSVRLRSVLSARGIQVVTTREADQSIDRNARAETANRANAQACLSLHVTESGSGVHLFASSLAPTPAIHFAAWKTAQSAWVTRSLALAGVLNSALGQAGMTVTLGRTPLPTIESMTCPAVAVEIAPQRSADHKITAEPDDPNYQAQIATALGAALLEWKSEAHQP